MPDFSNVALDSFAPQSDTNYYGQGQLNAENAIKLTEQRRQAAEQAALRNAFDKSILGPDGKPLQQKNNNGGLVNAL